MTCCHRCDQLPSFLLDEPYFVQHWTNYSCKFGTHHATFTLIESHNTSNVSLYLSPGSAGRRYEEFLGIPYAQPPIGDLRFRKPEIPLPWSNVYDATEWGNSCIQIIAPIHQLIGLSPESENCLFVNVHVPGGIDEIGCVSNASASICFAYNSEHSHAFSINTELPCSRKIREATEMHNFAEACMCRSN